MAQKEMAKLNTPTTFPNVGANPETDTFRLEVYEGYWMLTQSSSGVEIQSFWWDNDKWSTADRCYYCKHLIPPNVRRETIYFGGSHHTLHQACIEKIMSTAC